MVVRQTRVDLRSGRVNLTALTSNELARTMAWANDPDLKRLILRVSQVTPEDQRRWYERLQVDPSRLVFAVRTVEDGRHVGNTGFYGYSPEHGRAEFWILLGERDAWGRGLGSEVLALMLRFGFEGLGLNKVIVNVGVGNLAARRLYERHGFVHEGVQREHYRIEEEWIDVIQMSLLRREYGQAK